MTAQAVIVTRHVAKGEPNNFLHRAVAEGERFYLFRGATYGCINYDGGIALSEQPNTNPFFEFPENAIRVDHVCNFDRILFGGGVACTVCDAVEPM